MVFVLSLQVMEGRKVVNLLKKWVEPKNYGITASGGAVHAYQVFEEEKKLKSGFKCISIEDPSGLLEVPKK